MGEARDPMNMARTVNSAFWIASLVSCLSSSCRPPLVRRLAGPELDPRGLARIVHGPGVEVISVDDSTGDAVEFEVLPGC